MSAVADRIAVSASLTVARPAGVRIPIWLWILGSRVLVLFAGTWGALFSTSVPGWQRLDPQRISTSMGSLGNVLGAASVRWDAIGYISIAQHGYATSGLTRFFPLYPILIRALTPPAVSPVVAGVLISLVAFAVGLELLHRLTRWELGTRTADATLLLVAFSPFSFVFSAVYSMSLLFACAVGTFYLARQRRFVLASIVAACAALTRVEGILLLAPLALMYWRARGCPHNLREACSANLLALALPVLALGGFLTYLHSEGWGWLAPVTNQNSASMDRTLVGPAMVLVQSFRDTVVEAGQTLHGTVLPLNGVLTPAAQNVFYLVVLGVSVWALINAWRRLPMEYALFGALTLLVITSSAVAVEALKGIDRYVLPIFPLWIGAAAWIEDRQMTSVIVMASSALLVLYTIDFTRWISVF